MRTSWFVLVIAFTGCVSAPPIVPASDWECVSPRPRATMEAANATELSHVQVELATAQAELATARRAVVRPMVTPAHAPAMAVDAIWAPAIADQEHRKSDALVRIRSANTTWVTARLAWSESHLRAATAHVAVVQAQIQLARASYIDRHLLGTETYETAPFRAQLARAQAPYYAALHDEAAASTALVDASAKVASAKEEYASLARTSPMLPTVAATPSLQLAGFTIDRHAKPSYLKLR